MKLMRVYWDVIDRALTSKDIKISRGVWFNLEGFTVWEFLGDEEWDVIFG